MIKWKKFDQDFLDKIKVVLSVPRPAKWEEVTDEQRAVFEDPKIQRFLVFCYQTKCWMCKTRFDQPLYCAKGWNAKFLFHMKSTHGLEPEHVLLMGETITMREGPPLDVDAVAKELNVGGVVE
jgi:hypothetical protein